MYDNSSLLYELVRDYLRTKEGGLAPLTLRNYRSHLEGFYKWHPNSVIQDIRQRDVDLFIKRLKDKGYKNSSLNSCSYALKSFFVFCSQHGVKKDFTYQIFPKPEPQGHFFSNEDYSKMLDEVVTNERRSELDTANILVSRNVLILQLLIETGITLSEVSKVTLESFDLEKMNLRIKEKTRPDRIFPLKNSTILLVKGYLRVKGAGHLFFKRHDRAWHITNEPISTRSIDRMIKACSDGKYTPKDFRFTYIITHLIDKKGIYNLSDKIGGISDDTKTFFRKKLAAMGKPIEFKDGDYDAYEYLRHKYGKDGLLSLLEEKQLQVSFGEDVVKKNKPQVC